MRCFVPIFKIAMNIRKLLQKKAKNIAKGTIGPGVDCFLKPNQQFGKSCDLFSLARYPLLHHTNTPHIANSMVTNTGNHWLV